MTNYRLKQVKSIAFCNSFDLIKLPFVIKIFVLSIYEWLFYNGFTVVNVYAGVFSGASFSSYFVYASSEGPGESVSLCRLAYKQNKHVRHIVAFIKMLIGRRSDDPTSEQYRHSFLYPHTQSMELNDGSE